MTIELVAKFLRLLLETMNMAAIAASIGALVSLPVGFLASNLNRFRLLRLFCWLLVNCLRAIPAIIYAVILVKILGQGQITGIIALTLYSIGMLSKQLKDLFDQKEQTDIFLVSRASGLSSLQILISKLLPSIHLHFVESVFHRFEINVRNASILGILGAGGIGWLFSDAFTYFQYLNLFIYTALLALFLMGLEQVSIRLRSALYTANKTFKSVNTSFGRVISYIILVAINLNTFLVTFADNNYWARANFVPAAGLLQPTFGSVASEILVKTASSVFLAISATALGAVIAVPVALFAANLNGLRRALSSYLRVLLTFLRSVPDLIIVLIFVAIFGLNDLPVLIAISIGTIGVLGRFVSTSVESTNQSISDFAKTSGLSRLVFLTSVILQVHRLSTVKHMFHMSDINLRISLSLGVVGLGGVGVLISKALAVYEFGIVSAIVILIIVVVNLLEYFGKKTGLYLEKARF